MYLLLGLYSIGSFGQSDLEIELLNLGNSNGINYRSQAVEWGFKVTNVGITNANITPYEIYVSEDQILDINDIKVKEGNVGNNPFIPISGLNVGSSVYISSLLSSKFDFPPLLDVNKQYYIIFKVVQDIDGAEINTSNNTLIEPFYLTMEDKLEIINVYPNEALENKTPLFLIHGWQPGVYNEPGNLSIWDNFKSYYLSDFDLSDNFKLYYVRYRSNIVPINDLGHELRLELDNMTEIHDRQIVLLAHSMGGLVSRSFAKRTRIDGPFSNQEGGERVDRLITLGTPHHGSPMANGPNRNIVPSLLTGFPILPQFLIIVDNNFYNISQVVAPKHFEFNRSDLKWDNFDGLWNYGLFPYPEQENIWLNSDLMNGDSDHYFDNKIIAYGGYFSNNSLIYDFHQYYFPHQFLKNDLGYDNDGVVPLSSALFDWHTILKRREFIDYYHDEIVKGNPSSFDIFGIDNALFGMIKVDLLNSSALSHILVSDNVVNFPDTVIGNTSSYVITIQNPSSIVLTIDSFQLFGIDNSQFQFTAPALPFDIAPNESQEITLSFQPTLLGEKTLDFRINNFSVNNPELNIQLSGTVVQTATTDYNTNTESQYDFGDVYINGGTKLVTLNVSNSSSATYTVAGLTITGVDSSLFGIVQQPTLPKIFNPGDSDIIVLSFDPDTIGEKTAIIEASFENNTILDTANLIGNGVNTTNNPNVPKLTNYEYWYNDDYASKQNIVLTGTNSNESLSFLATPLNTTSGLNVMHLRVKDSDGSWSSVSSDYVHIQNATNGTADNQIVTYEYWFDEDYTNKISANTTASNLVSVNIDALTTNVEIGLHNFNIRFLDSKSQWSSVVTEYVLIHNNYGNNNILSYEYWFDEDYANKVVGSTTTESLIVFDSDLSTNNLDRGLHRFNIRFKDSKQTWSSIQTDYVLKINENSLGFNIITEYRYWFNEDFVNMTSVTISPIETFVLMDSIDMSSFTTETNNYIHFQFKDIYGNWSSVLTEDVYVCGVIAQPIITSDGGVLSTNSASSYQWYLDGVLINGETNQFYEASSGGNYSVEITNPDGCNAVSEDFLFETLTVTHEELYSFKIFPNPSENEVFIISKLKKGQLEVFNSVGQRISIFDTVPEKVDISNFDSGVYFFKIKSDNKVQTEKVIKM